MHRTEPKIAPSTKRRARAMRATSPVAEKILWEIVRGRRLGRMKFRRQQPLGPYFADFYCEADKLVLELDGSSHERREEHDRRRDEYLRSRGLTVLRITNEELVE